MENGLEGSKIGGRKINWGDYCSNLDRKLWESNWVIVVWIREEILLRVVREVEVTGFSI